MLKIIRIGEVENERTEVAEVEVEIEGREFIEKLAKRNITEDKDIVEKVTEIVNNVRKNGDQALFAYTREFDGAELSNESIKVGRNEIDKAYSLIDEKLLGIIRRAKQNIQNFHLKQKENSWITTEENGVILGQVIRPLDIVGIYVPGGTAPLISSVLMNAVPARTAGVGRIVMATPPDREGNVNPAVLVAARESGIDDIYKVGGAQAVSALAFGTESVQKVDKIFGPGNIYVTTAKRLVYGYCDIDMFAGPSEITIVADESANAKYVAADLLSQAEHDILSSSILITDSENLAKETQREVWEQYSYLDRKDIIRESLQNFGAIIIVKNIKMAIDLVNIIAPEHLELCVNAPFNILGDVKNAGAIFLGHYSSEPVGDYWAGPSHVLPTGGTARYFSPLNLSDFMKKSSIISYTKNALYQSQEDIISFALAEGLTAHANAIKIRIEGKNGLEI